LRAERARGIGETVRHRLIPPLTQGLIDRDVGGLPTTAAGTVFPQPRVETAAGKTALLDDILPSEFLVVSATIDPQTALGERQLASLRRIGGVRLVLRSPRDRAPAEKDTVKDVVTMATTDELFAHWLAETGAIAAVVRPDRYVYGVARTPAELVRLVDDLSGALE
jgi:3-(3-hydroxy-phenyl)propionate hydroxylase